MIRPGHLLPSTPRQVAGRVLWFSLVLLLGAACGRATNAAETTALRIDVDEDGIIGLTRDDLSDAGLAIEAWSTGSLQLTQGGVDVPYLLIDETLLFYGQASDSRYTTVRPYILRSGEPGLAMVETTVGKGRATAAQTTTASVYLEENEHYLSVAQTADGEEPWYWQPIQVGSTVEVTVDLPEVADGSGRFRARLWGTSYDREIEPDHDLDIVINDQLVGSVAWDGQTAYIADIGVPAGTLRAGANRVLFDNSAPGATLIDIMQLDWVEIAYEAPVTAVDDRLSIDAAGDLVIGGFRREPLLFDVSDAARPSLLTGWAFGDQRVFAGVAPGTVVAAVGPSGFAQPRAMAALRPSPWASTDNQADLLIVTTDALAPALAPLVSARESEGLAVAVATVEEIYDAFGHGEASPESIQAFVRHAYENWAQPRPRYLFLVGDASSDYRGYTHALPENNVPSMLVTVNYSGETVSDARLADVDGDRRPDLAVGRWPVSSRQEVEALVTRTLAYETGTPSRQMIFAADGTSPEFSYLNQGIVADAELPTDHLTVLDGPTADTVATTWNTGAWLVTYSGHGSVDTWGKDQVFTSDAVTKLSDSGAPPIVLQLTCLTGLFAHPAEVSLSEQMLLNENGPVLLIAATSLTVSTSQRPFAVNFLSAIQDPAVVRIGDALQLAKQDLDIESNEGLREVSDTFGLLGDPTARILRPSA